MNKWNRFTQTLLIVSISILSLCSIFIINFNTIFFSIWDAELRAQYFDAHQSNDTHPPDLRDMDNVGTLTNCCKGKPLMIRVNSSLADEPQDKCASWIPREKRKVLFVELHTWEKYYSKDSKTTGEYYISASWDYALGKIGFLVERVSHQEYYERMTSEQISQYYRIFVRDPRWHRYYDHHDILCKVRPMYYFGEWYRGRNKKNIKFKWFFDEKQIVVAHPEDHNTFLGYFPHNILSNIRLPSPVAGRGKVGLLYGKKPEYFEPYTNVIGALIEAGFSLHTTCKDEVNNPCPFPAEVVRHKNIGPAEYAALMQQFSFMLGFTRPVTSPSPLVGLSYGVSFLNPIRSSGGDTAQHSALSRLGMPYIYNVDLVDVDGVVQAAEWASKYRFSSYVPPEFRVNTLVDRMCALVEDNALCLCPNPMFGNDTLDWKKEKKMTDVNIDCRASSYVKKGPIFPFVEKTDSNLK